MNVLIDAINIEATDPVRLDAILGALIKHLIHVRKNGRDTGIYVPINQSNPPSVQITGGRIYELARIDTGELSSVCVRKHGEIVRYLPTQIWTVQMFEATQT